MTLGLTLYIMLSIIVGTCYARMTLKGLQKDSTVVDFINYTKFIKVACYLYIWISLIAAWPLASIIMASYYTKQNS